MWAFNMKVTAYPKIVLLLVSHSCFVALVLSLGTFWETALDGVPPSPSMISVCLEQDCPRQRLLAIWTFSFVLGHFFLLDVGLRLDMGGAGVTGFFGPTICITIFNVLEIYILQNFF